MNDITKINNDEIAINLSINQFNANIEYSQNEQQEIIKNLKLFLKKMLDKMLKKDDDFDHKTLSAINNLYITLNKAINTYNENNMILITKLFELNELLHPKEITGTNENNEDELIKTFIENMMNDKNNNDGDIDV